MFVGLATRRVWAEPPLPHSRPNYINIFPIPVPYPGRGELMGSHPPTSWGKARSGAGLCRRDHQQHLPILKHIQNLDGLRQHIKVLDVGTVALVVPNHVARVQDRQREDGAGGHEAHEPNVSTIVHECNLASVVV